MLLAEALAANMQGTRMTLSAFKGLRVPQCITMSASSVTITWFERMPWIFVIIAIAVAVGLIAMIW